MRAERLVQQRLREMAKLGLRSETTAKPPSPVQSSPTDENQQPRRDKRLFNLNRLWPSSTSLSVSPMITAPRPIRTSVLKLLPAFVIVGVVCAGSVWVCNALVISRPSVAVTTVLPEPVTRGSISLESASLMQAPAQALEAPLLAPAVLADL